MKNIRVEAYSDMHLQILVRILRGAGPSSGGGGRPFFILSSQRFRCPRHATLSLLGHTVTSSPHTCCWDDTMNKPCTVLPACHRCCKTTTPKSLKCLVGFLRGKGQCALRL